MKVRRLTVADDPTAAIALLQRFFREEGFDTTDAAIAENTRRMLGIDTCAVLLAEDGGRAVGVATLSMEFGIEFGWSGEVGDLFVLPECRGKGVSRQLLLAAEDILRQRGGKGYQVTVTPFAEAQHGLRAYYSKLGFAGEGRLILWKDLPR